jgi:integrase/recombinase XerD
LLSAALALPPSDSLRPHTYYTLFALLYSTGIRIGEAFGLKLKDCLLDEKLVYIAEGKFRKSRWVPLHSSISTVLEAYVHRRMKIGPKSPESPLFINGRGHGLRHCVVFQTFRHLLMQCGISHHKNGGPRIHDLRHTFAVNRLLSWYRDGQDVNVRLPALATYMGHVGVGSTHVYLKPTAALFEQVNTRFHSHYLQNIKLEGAIP